MKSLSAKQLSEKEKHVLAIKNAIERLEQVIDGYNKAVEQGKVVVEEALENLNRAIADADDWRGGISSDMESYYDERTEKWQEGDAGSDYSSWKDEFSDQLEQVEVEFPEELQMPDVNALDSLESLPEAP